MVVLSWCLSPTLLLTTAFRPPSPCGRGGPVSVAVGRVPPLITKVDSPRPHERRKKRRHRAAAVALPPLTKEESLNRSAHAFLSDEQRNNSSSDDNNLNQGQRERAATRRMVAGLRDLWRYPSNREAEAAIVGLGRRGRTEEALDLYHALWALDGLRQRYRQLQQNNKGSRAGKVLQLTLTHNKDNNHSNGRPCQSPARSALLPPELFSLLARSRLRPTTRLLNAALDACARSSRSGGWPRRTAFALLDHAADPRNADGTKKPGGALSPNVFTFGCLLKCCAKSRDLDKALEILRILEEGKKYPDVVPNEVIYGTVISACERSVEPRADLAMRVLNRALATLSPKDASAGRGGGMGVVGFNAAVSAMARAAEWEMAVRLLGEMLLHSHPLPAHPIVETLGAILCAGGDVPCEPSLLQHTSSVPAPDGVTFGTVLAACERAGRWEELLRVAEAAEEYGVRLDGMALTSALKACQQLGLADEALEYLDRMKHLGDVNNMDNRASNGNRRSSSSQTTRGRQWKGAKQPLRGPDGVAYRLAISACARAPCGHRWQDGIRLLQEMRAKNTTDCTPDVMAYTAAIAGCSEAGMYTSAMSLIADMRQEGIRPNVVTFSAVITACAQASANCARRQEEDDRTAGLAEVKAPMMRALRLLEAMRSTKSTVKPNIVTYNAAIRACAEGLNLKGAFDLLKQLKDDGLEPTIVTYGSLMTACERVGDIEAASKVFKMVKEEEERGAAAGEEEERKQLRVNEIIYGAAISCCRKAQQPERALLLLRRMISEELSPNTATFNTVIAALSEQRPDTKTTNNHLMWEKALAVYRVMVSKHAPPGVTPNRQTYSMLIRSLSANLEPLHAETMLTNMRTAGFVPDVDLYTMTVRSYEKCGSPFKALRLMEAMREVGYDFYGIKVFDEAFKNGVRVLNLVGGAIGDNEGVVPHAMSEETIHFDEDEYQLI